MWATDVLDVYEVMATDISSLSRIAINSSNINSFDFSPDKKYIITSTRDDKIKLWINGNAKDLEKKGELANFSKEDIYKRAGIDLLKIVTDTNK